MASNHFELSPSSSSSPDSSVRSPPDSAQTPSDDAPQNTLEIDIMDGWRELNFMRYRIFKTPDFDDSDDSDDGPYGERYFKPPPSFKRLRSPSTSDTENAESRLQELNRLFQEEVQTDMKEKEDAEIERIKNDPNILPEELEEILEMRGQMGRVVRRDDENKQYDLKNMQHHHLCHISDIFKLKKHVNKDMTKVWLLPGQTGKLSQINPEQNKFLQQEAIKRVLICGIAVESWMAGDDKKHYLYVHDGSGEILCVSKVMSQEEVEESEKRLTSRAERYLSYKKDYKENPTEGNRKAKDYTCLCMEFEMRKLQLMEIKEEIPKTTKSARFERCTSETCCNTQYVLVYGLVVQNDTLGRYLVVNQQKLISLYTARAYRSMLLAREKY